VPQKELFASLGLLPQARLQTDLSVPACGKILWPARTSLLQLVLSFSGWSLVTTWGVPPSSACYGAQQRAARKKTKRNEISGSLFLFPTSDPLNLCMQLGVRAVRSEKTYVLLHCRSNKHSACWPVQLKQ